MSTDTPDLESILRRVRKLLAIAEDGRGDPNEAAAAAQQAERIMRKYQIDHADTILAGMQAGGDFGEQFCYPGINPFVPGPLFYPFGRIAVAVAKLYDAQVRILADGRLRFEGFSVDAILARFTYLMLVNNAEATANLWKAREKATARARTEWLDGYARAVCASLREALEEKQREGAAGAGSALVIAKGQLVAQHFGAPNYGRSRSGPASAASAAGWTAGSHVDVGRRGVGAGPGAARIAG